jgi:hypothetical protein
MNIMATIRELDLKYMQSQVLFFSLYAKECSEVCSLKKWTLKILLLFRSV